MLRMEKVIVTHNIWGAFLAILLGLVGVDHIHKV